MSAAKARLEEELGKLESLLRLLDEYEHNPQDEKLLALLSQKLKVIVPELRQLGLDPAYKTPECAPLLVTLGQGVKNAVLRTRGLSFPSATASGSGGGGDKQGSASSAAQSMPQTATQAVPAPSQPVSSHQDVSPRGVLAEPKPLKGYLKKRGDKGLVKNYKLRYFEQRGDKVMYYHSDKLEDMKQVVGWIDLSKMIGVERNAEPLGFDVRTSTGRVYTLMVVATGGARESFRGTESAEAQAALQYWVGGLARWKQYRQDTIARMNNPTPAAAMSGQSVSPKSSLWSGMSVLSDEDDSSASSMRFSVSSGRSSLQMAEQDAAPEESSLGLSRSSGALPRLAAAPMSFDMSPVAGAAEADSPLSAQQTRSQSMRRNNSARKLNFDEAPPVNAVVTTATSATSPRPGLTKQRSQQDVAQQAELLQEKKKNEELARRCEEAHKKVEELQWQVATARGEAHQWEKDAEELRRLAEERAALAEERAALAATLKEQLSARDAALEKQEEVRLELEGRVREAQARGAMAEADLRATAGELENRDHVIADLRSKMAVQGPGGELGRVMGGSGKQADMIAYLGKELEHEKDANEAHQQRVRFLAGQLAQAERRGKAELELCEAQCEALRGAMARLRERAAAGGSEAAAMAKEVEELKREYFQALGVGMKLNLAMQGQSVNVDLASLYEDVCDTVPHSEWNRFLSLKLALSTETGERKRHSLMAEIAVMLRPKH